MEREQAEKKYVINKFIDNRPPARACFAYGSGVFYQGKSSYGRTLIDLIFVVDNIESFLIENIKENPKDFAKLGFLPPNNTNIVIPSSKTIYLINIKENNRYFKYGLIEYNNFLEAFESLNSMFLPGRFSKPVMKIKSDVDIDKAIDNNLFNYFLLGLLTLPNKYRYYNNLCEHITTLSYLNDPRNGIVENFNKSAVLFYSNHDAILEMYKSYTSDFLTINQDNIMNIDFNKLTSSVNLLPSTILDLLDKKGIDKEDLYLLRKELLKFHKAMNRRDSYEQILSTFIINGPVRSSAYIGNKLLKRIY